MSRNSPMEPAVARSPRFSYRAPTLSPPVAKAAHDSESALGKGLGVVGSVAGVVCLFICLSSVALLLVAIVSLLDDKKVTKSTARIVEAASCDQWMESSRNGLAGIRLTPKKKCTYTVEHDGDLFSIELDRPHEPNTTIPVYLVSGSDGKKLMIQHPKRVAHYAIIGALVLAVLGAILFSCSRNKTCNKWLGGLTLFHLLA